MSQKVRIVGVKHSGGSVYLGEDRGNPMWTKNPDKIMDYLSDGWRSRFNQHRQYRTKRRLLLDPKTEEKLWVDVPLGGTDLSEERTDAQARKECSWLSVLPTAVISSARVREETEWFSALKRIKTLLKQGKSRKEAGEPPEFKSFHQNGQRFTCWFNGGENANFHQTGRKSGVVTITGMTPRKLQKPGEPSHWKINIRVRTSQPIRPYTSVEVNWTKKELVFVNEPLPVTDTHTGAVVGIDMGVANTFTTSDGETAHIPTESPSTQQRYLELERKLARQDRTNGAKADGDKSAKYRSNRRTKTVSEMARIKGHEARRREDWQHKQTTRLVREYDVIALEDLNVEGMTKSARGTKEKPGKRVRQKAGLNRSILEQNWGRFQEMLEYKTQLADKILVPVNPAFTSQQCSQCGHTSAQNRESQAIFECVECGHKQNADVNAAQNILIKGLETLDETGQDYGLGRGGEVRLVSKDNSTADETLTPALHR